MARFHPREQVIVDVQRVGIQIAAIVMVLEKRIDAGRRVIAAKVEDVEGMVAVADISPHLTRARLAGKLRIQVRHLGRVGVQCLRLADDLRH
jgi:hypothetical protein